MSEEPYAASTLGDALAAATAVHGRLAAVLTRCSYVVDGTPVGRRDHGTVALTEAGTIDVLPPFAGGSGLAESGAGDSATIPSVSAARAMPTSLVVAVPVLLASLCAAALAAASSGGRVGLLVALAIAQVVLIAGWFRAAHLVTPGEASGAIAAIGAAVAADIVMMRVHPQENVRALAGVMAGLVIAAFIAQLARRDGRGRLTQALAASVGSGALAVAASVLIAVRAGAHGSTVVAVAYLAVAVGLLPVQHVVRWWLAVPIAAAIGTGTGALVAHHVGAFGAGTGAVVALVAVVPAACARISLARMPFDTGSLQVAATVPLAAAAPVVLMVARIMVG